jgi:pimeloyl-ACP methyl ester carboxylesterase
VGAKKLESYGKGFLSVITGTDTIVHPTRRKLAGQPAANIFDQLLAVQVELERGELGTDKPLSCSTSVLRNIAEMQPKRVASMTMGGAILKFSVRSRILIFLGNMTKSIVPYMWIYKVFAIIMMPNRNHKESRHVFIREAKKLYQKEFIRWFKLTGEVIPLLKFFRQAEVTIPTLYVMGAEDYMFLPSVKEVVNHQQLSQLQVISNCGHVVNVEQPNKFNNLTINFLKTI